jgi:hypothetical protein
VKGKIVEGYETSYFMRRSYILGQRAGISILRLTRQV